MNKFGYDKKIAMLKQDLVYERERVKELEKKCNSQEAKLKKQHEAFEKLKVENREIKDDSVPKKSVSLVSLIPIDGSYPS